MKISNVPRRFIELSKMIPFSLIQACCFLTRITRHEVHAHEVHAYEMHAHEMHVYEVHTHEMHACEIHATKYTPRGRDASLGGTYL